MRRRLLQFIGTYSFRNAWWLLPIMLIMTLLAASTLGKMRYDTSLVAFLPPPSPQETKIREMLGDYRNLEPILVIIRLREGQMASADEMRDMTREMARLLNDPLNFQTPVYRVNEDFLSYYDSLSNIRLIQLMTEQDWNQLRSLLETRITDSETRLRRLLAYRNSAVVPNALKEIAPQDPIGSLADIRQRLAYSRGPTRLETDREGFFVSNDRKAMLIQLYPVLSPESGRDADRVLRMLNRTRESFQLRYPAFAEKVQIEFSGSYVTAAEQINTLRDRLNLIYTFAFPLAILWILLVFRKLEAVIFIILPPIIGLIWTLGLAYLLFGSVTLVTMLMLMLITAVGMHFNIHMYHRFTLELYRQLNYYRALRSSYVETGRGVLASAAVLAMLFLLMYLTSLIGVKNGTEALALLTNVRGFGHIGVVAGMGILCNLLASLTAIPLLAAIKQALSRGMIRPVELYQFHVERLYSPAVSRPRSTLLVMLLFCVFFGYHGENLNFSPNFTPISPFFFQADDEDLSEIRSPAASGFPRSGRPILAVVHGDNLQQALEKNDRLYQNLLALGNRFNVFSYDSLRRILPSIASQADSLRQLRELDLLPFERIMSRISLQYGFKPRVYESYIDALNAFREQSENPVWLEATIDERNALLQALPRYVTSRKDGVYIVTSIYPDADGFKPWLVDELSKAVGQGIEGLTFIGDPILERELARVIKYNLAILIVCSFFGILAALIIHFRSLRLGWITFIPIVAQMIWLTGGMAIVGLRIHFFTVLAMPLVLSMAMDNAMQVTQYYLDRDPCPPRQTMQSLGRVPILAAGVVMCLVGILVVSGHPGFREFGACLSLGMIFVVLGTEMFLPALLELLGKGQPVGGIFTLETESRPQMWG